MEHKITLHGTIEICDICGTRFRREKNSTVAGFGRTKYKILGWLETCPKCYKVRDKTNPELFNQIVEKLIELKRLRKQLKKDIKGGKKR